ncbi:MAG: Fe-S cluster assembly protein SufD [Planctomycetales bacterium]|nr:Fe-S cluster assembly protein SufD [Planctomycetales bacterium]
MANSVLSETGFTQEAFDAFIETRDEPGWLIDQRRAAWQVFCEKPMPSKKEEEWMRTDIRLFKLDRYGIPSATENTQSGEAVLKAGVTLGGEATTVNGNSVSSHVDQKWTDKGVVFGSLSQVAKDHSELVQKYLFKKCVDPHYDKFAALHAACWTSGSILFVPRGVSVDEPFYSQSTLDDGTDLGHTLVVLEDGAEATFMNENCSVSVEATGFHCGATELIVGPRAHLRFVNLQDWGHNVWHFAHQHAFVDQDAQLQWTVGALGSRLSKVNQQVSLVGRGASCQVNGVMFTENKQHLSYHTQQNHVAPDCRSDFLYKAALQDKSRTVWRGMIKVEKEAQKTDGYQRNDNLLLSHNARADAIPGLEIEADDVRCTHGATTGQVDEELIFYAQTRGFTRKEATRLIVTGFFQQVFDRITIESVRDALGLAIARRVRDYE